MTNANDPINAHLTYDQTSGKPNGFLEGLTKREYFAAMAMQGLLFNFKENGHYGNSEHSPMVAQLAVEQADALINALNQSK